MLDCGEKELAGRAQALRAAIGPEAEIVRATGRVGGGALPLLELEGPAVELHADLDPVSLLGALRASEPPVIGRISDGRVLLDPRTLSEDELPAVAAAARAALGAG
jgi:L-seryl-tRNA(Ser) seleniumtransferase